MNSIYKVSRPDNLGFALIEALIAVVVLAFGLLALTALQSALVRSSADSKARSQIAAYMSGEMDRIRSGGTIAAKTAAAVTASECVPTATASDISCAAWAAGISSLSQTASAQIYYADAAGGFSPTNANTGKNAFFTRITVNLSWTDATGGSRQLGMTTDVSPLTLSMSKVLVDRVPSGSGGLRPTVDRPETAVVADGMIPIATGGAGDEATAATNPKPQLLGGNSGTYVSDTRFDIVTYSDGAADGFVRLNKKIETAVVGCTCQKDTDGFTGNGPGADYRAFLLQKGFRPTYWGGRGYEAPVAALAAVDSSPVDQSQSELCDVCCRDHKDPDTETGPKFSPWEGQNSAHYRLNSDGALVQASSGEEYLEACRLVRVNGVFRVAADAMVRDNSLVPTQVYPALVDTGGSQLPGVTNNGHATSALLAPAGKPLYVNYVYDALATGFFSTSSVAASGNSVTFSAVQASAGLNNPTYVPIKPANDRRWLHSRVFVVDYLESDAQARLKSASETCTAPDTQQKKAQCVLPFVPLASINTTELAFWSPRGATAEDVAAAPAPLNTLASNYLNLAAAAIRRFNSGLALFSAINPAEATTDRASSLSPARDEQLFVQLGPSAPSAPVWLITPSPNPSTARFFGDVLNPMRGYAETSSPNSFAVNWSFPGGNQSPTEDSNKGNDPAVRVVGGGICTPGIAGNTSNPYTCSSSESSALQISLAGYNRIEYSDFNNPCGTGKVERPTCVVYSFTGATVSAPSATLPATSYVVDAGTLGKLTEKGTLTIPNITPGNSSVVTVNFGNKVETDATSTCLAGSTVPEWTLTCR